MYTVRPLFHASLEEKIMSVTQERAAMIDKIRRLPEQIEYLVGVLSPQELAGKFIAGEWSAAQNIHHLVDSHMNSYVRCRLIMTEEEPALKPYDQERWAALPDAEDADVSASVQILRGMHTRWVRFWETLPEVAWQRAGIHEVNGPMTLEGILRLYAGHGEAHIEQIRRTVAAQYAEPPTSLDELLARVDREWGRLNGLIRRMTPAQLETGGDDGWSPKDHLAHVTAWEHYLIGTVIGGRPAHETFGITEEQFEAWDIDQQNDHLVQASANKSLAQVMAEFHSVHEQARAAVAGIDFADWAARTREWEGQQSPILNWIAGNSYDHYLEHWQWLPVV
jgi:hypothetical protein